MSLTCYEKQLHIKSKSASVSLQSGWEETRGGFLNQTPKCNQRRFQISLSPRQIYHLILEPIVNISREEKYKRLEFPVPSGECDSTEQPVQNLREDEAKLEMDRKQELKKAGLNDLQAKHVELEVIPMTFEHKDKETFISTWKDSWKALKHQLRHDTARSRRQNTPLTKISETLMKYHDLVPLFTVLGENDCSSVTEITKL